MRRLTFHLSAPITVALDVALTSLAAIVPRKARVIELKYFRRLTTEEPAEVLGVSTSTVERDWHTAKIWLHREIKNRELVTEFVNRES